MTKKQQWTGARHSSPLVLRRSGEPGHPHYLDSNEAAYLDKSVSVGQALNDHYWASNAGTYEDLMFYIDEIRPARASDKGETMTQVLNYHDAVVYDTDVALFGDGEWLNDNCINWFFRLLEHEVFPGRTDLLFMDPAVVSCMMNQCDDLEEYEDLGRGLELATRSTVFVPVNNAAGPFSRGSHWSLLVCDRGIAGGDERRSRWRFRHFDSSEGSNRTPAELTAAKFVQMLGEKIVEEEQPSRVEHVRDAPQQRNAFDCGMYTILLAERLASKAAAATAAASQQSLTTPTPPVVASAVTGVPHENMNPRQDNEAAPAGKGGEVGTGGDPGGGGLFSVGRVGRDKNSVAVEDSGSGVGSRAVETMAMSPKFVSSARTLARERLSRCIENQGRC